MLQNAHDPAHPHRVEPAVTVQTAAGVLGMPQKTLFRTLRRLGLIDRNNRAARIYVRQGLVTSEPSVWTHPITNKQHQYDRPLLTQAGIDWLRQNGVGA